MNLIKQGMNIKNAKNYHYLRIMKINTQLLHYPLVAETKRVVKLLQTPELNKQEIELISNNL